MKSLLAIDTSTENCSVALVHDGKLTTRDIESPREHSQKLLPFVEEVLDRAGVSLAELDGLVVGAGPGSFTGVRIGVSMAQGLAFSADLPVYPVCSLQALAQQAIRKNDVAGVVACIDARMGEVYYALYANENGVAVAQSEPAVAKPDTNLIDTGRLKGWGTAGTGWDVYADILDENHELKHSDNSRLPLAEDMLIVVNSAGVDPVQAELLEPLYVRNEVTWQKLPGR
ncbi:MULTISPECIES: tRNA (adenosine(37)-N6)-threonylcarbamoyltransferase complex dimerization subunit type 1 TsaB [unclassified Idiomarina]|jgi:tRNA threonylcarbamoyladenosine biosynthesis protein TsaB|uniref:tRNA (adenosine(37)-N6)-threonylcarbamoyltransferase complex dimerization subunit type 1 TsaB n=1 Tax=unclassified Idiomarina TaxID=2614829 RepID=UPI000C5F9153|nr:MULTISPECIES: tRNA (adenosine(37)-N6)-threonylcarbamoyltransferase complex dimerization subunit type 1 TsaB [unclassified Idiomarina]MBF37867.1 tRNA (adenosine(37)-N6)-threonylcarbamoyltransferase complex dimerization subunit type 1 TsaB [Idiomarinaceae bacterium]MCJ8316454.1 tRNA (adenosine(37)-N6)-threonylcarbamoyltransferase complex dimerization subunit type 1 TsaB [Idiomarina sp.]NQZ15178.1 tRNA (adenosine(37)-N6)-threonylcarbamoyltransferase complex dimerization subunit type 1 TsaB [Idio|tara:strand:+ start:23033 stop:23716 length:684 start_codon:yes stop_codon:yes gene_type:complete